VKKSVIFIKVKTKYIFSNQMTPKWLFGPLH